MGQPVFAEVAVYVPEAGRWEWPPVPFPWGDVTVREVVPENGSVSPGEARLRLCLQFFRTGDVRLPALPVRLRLRDGRAVALSWPTCDVAVGRRIEGPGPFSLRPPRGPAYPPAARVSRWAVWVTATAVAAACGAAWLWVALRRRPRGRPVEKPPPGIEVFLLELDAAWEARKGFADPRVPAAAVLRVFREFLSWRSGVDISHLTSEEIRQASRGFPGAGADNLEELARLLRLGEETCFAPDSSLPEEMGDMFRRHIVSWGSGPGKGACADAVSQP